MLLHHLVLVVVDYRHPDGVLVLPFPLPLYRHLSVPFDGVAHRWKHWLKSHRKAVLEVRGLVHLTVVAPESASESASASASGRCFVD